jgi:hypothetical protein
MDSTDRGVAPGAGLINAKAGYKTAYGGGSFWDSDIMLAIDWAVSLTSPYTAGAISCSFGGLDSPDQKPNGNSSLSEFMDSVISDFNIPIVVAAGNSGADNPYRYVEDPGSAYNVITVGNMDDKGTISRTDDSIDSTSAVGPTGDGRLKPDIVAPGQNSKLMNINGTGIMSCNYKYPTSSSTPFVPLAGTSMATPHVTASCLLVFGFTGAFDEKEIKALLLNTAGDYGSSGPDNIYGYGYLNLDSALLYRNNLFQGSFTSSNPDFYAGSEAAGDTATLLWDRHVIYNGNYPSQAYPLSELDLQMFDGSNNNLISSQTDSINNVKQVKSGSGYSSVVIKVKPHLAAGISAEGYALATKEAFSKANPPNLMVSLAFPGSVASGSTFTVQATVTNGGGINAFGVNSTLNLPSGFTIAQGANPQSLGTIAGGSSNTASWSVKAPTVSGATGYSISDSATSSSYGETYSSSVSKNIQVTLIPIDDIAVYSNGWWAIKYGPVNQIFNGTADKWLPFGAPGYTPVVGDFNHDSIDDIAVYYNGWWAIKYGPVNLISNGNADLWVPFGASGYAPVVGDFNHDGIDDIAVYSNGWWAIKYGPVNQISNGNADLWVPFGASGYTPVVGDFNHDGIDDIAVYSNGWWAIKYGPVNQISNGNADLWVPFGASGYAPIVGDFNNQ